MTRCLCVPTRHTCVYPLVTPVCTHSSHLCVPTRHTCVCPLVTPVCAHSSHLCVPTRHKSTSRYEFPGNRYSHVTHRQADRQRDIVAIAVPIQTGGPANKHNDWNIADRSWRERKTSSSVGCSSRLVLSCLAAANTLQSVHAATDARPMLIARHWRLLYSRWYTTPACSLRTECRAVCQRKGKC